MKKECHGKRKDRLYAIWASMKQRCSNVKCKSYKNYGGRGIYVCDSWKDSFMCFYYWAKKSGYRTDLTLERLDNSNGYYPENCSWVDKFCQASNKRNNRLITAFGETKHLNAWLRDPRCVCKETQLRNRLKRGVSPQTAISDKQIDLHRISISGLKGVHWDNNLKKWRARIHADGKFLHLGLFDSKEKAYEAYLESRQKLN